MTKTKNRAVAIVVTTALVLMSYGVQQSRANGERPNILIIMADDLGFSDLSCYGSEIATPALDSLATAGFVFSNFHSAATCSPTRAMLLTGIDHHRAGMGNMYEFLESAPEQEGQPGYEGYLTNSVVTIAEVLKTVGYHTAIAGKWHLGRRLVQAQAPIGRGFDDSWVLWSGWAQHFAPEHSKVFIDGEGRARYPEGRYSTNHYTDKLIEFADHAVDQHKPFLLFAAYTAPHWPLEAPDEMIAKQRGKYDLGYDELREHRTAGLIEKGILPRGITTGPATKRRPQLHHSPPTEASRSWKELSATERVYSARLMEVHAAMIESLDQNIGRLLRHLRRRHELDNTMIVFLSDNGAAPLATLPDSPENHLQNVGRPGSFVGFGPEWARATTGPLRLMKGYATEGGTRVPAIIKLPGAKRHRVTDEFASVLDLAPTIYELAGASYPKTFRNQQTEELDGFSLIPYLTGKQDRIHSQGRSMGWELFGRAAFRRGKWKITWIEQPFGASAFELFDIESDPGETRDVRATFPDVYKDMVAGFDEYARTNGVIISRPPHWQVR